MPALGKTVTFRLGLPRDAAEPQAALASALLTHICPYCGLLPQGSLPALGDAERTGQDCPPIQTLLSLRCCCWLQLCEQTGSDTSFYPHFPSQHSPQQLHRVWSTPPPGFLAPATVNFFQCLNLSCSLTYWFRPCLCLYLEQIFPLIIWLKSIHASGLSVNSTSSRKTSLTTSLPV